MDFRIIEDVLREFFADNTTVAAGELYTATATIHTITNANEESGGVLTNRTKVSVPEDHSVEIVSLSDLARVLADLYPAEPQAPRKAADTAQSHSQ